MLNEKFELGDTVRILTVPEMLQHLHCTSGRLHDEYDWNDRTMPQYCGKVGAIISEISPNSYLRNHPGNGGYRLADCGGFIYYSWMLERLGSEVKEEDWNALLEGGAV